MRKSFAPYWVAATAAALVSPAALASRLKPVTLDARALSAGGIQTIALQPLKSAPRIAGYGIVLDPAALMRRISRLIAARSALAAAHAKAVLARDAARRASHLYGARRNISQAALQRARSALAVAEARRSTAAMMFVRARLQMRARWGRRLTSAALSAGAPLPALERGALNIVEISLPLGEALGHPPAITLARCPDGAQVRLRLLSRAPDTAAGVGGVSLLYLLRAQSAAPIGTPLVAALDTSAAESGVEVPRSAVVWHHGEPWVFRETRPGSFVPAAIPHAFIAGGGYFVPARSGAALHAGDRIVTAGAALVYSAALQMAPSAQTAKAARASGDDD